MFHAALARVWLKPRTRKILLVIQLSLFTKFCYIPENVNVVHLKLRVCVCTLSQLPLQREIYNIGVFLCVSSVSINHKHESFHIIVHVSGYKFTFRIMIITSIHFYFRQHGLIILPSGTSMDPKLRPGFESLQKYTQVLWKQLRTFPMGRPSCLAVSILTVLVSLKIIISTFFNSTTVIVNGMLVWMSRA